MKNQISVTQLMKRRCFSLKTICLFTNVYIYITLQECSTFTQIGHMAIVGKHTELNVKDPILCGFAPKEINNNTAKQVKGVIIFVCFVQAQITNSY